MTSEIFINSSSFYDKTYNSTDNVKMKDWNYNYLFRSNYLVDFSTFLQKFYTRKIMDSQIQNPLYPSLSSDTGLHVLRTMVWVFTDYNQKYTGNSGQLKGEYTKNEIVIP